VPKFKIKRTVHFIAFYQSSHTDFRISIHFVFNNSTPDGLPSLSDKKMSRCAKASFFELWSRSKNEAFKLKGTVQKPFGACA